MGYAILVYCGRSIPGMSALASCQLEGTAMDVSAGGRPSSRSCRSKEEKEAKYRKPHSPHKL